MCVCVCMDVCVRLRGCVCAMRGCVCAFVWMCVCCGGWAAGI